MDSEEAIGYQLTQNFIFFMDILKQPEEVFDCRSRDYKLAKAWLDKLSTGRFETIDELRQRNIYMSHLMACLNDGKLTGPFVSLPKPDPFNDSVDFAAKVKVKRVCPRPTRGMTASEKACLAAQGTPPCECDYVCCDSNAERRSESEKKDCNNTGSPFDRICGYMTQYVNVPACLEASLDASLYSSLHLHRAPYHSKDTAGAGSKALTEPSTSNYGKVNDSYEKYDDYCSDSLLMRSDQRDGDNNNTERTLYNQQGESDQEENYGHIMALLKAIASELRGEQTPGSNDFLEHELARYKKFIMRHSSLATKMSKLEAQPTLRSFLLLNLQNDLVKLLNESSQPEVNMKRAFGFA